MARIARDSIKSAGVLLAMTVAAVVAISPLAMPRAFATTGYPNVGVFEPNSLHCGRADTKTGPILQFGGRLPTKQMVIIRVTVDGVSEISPDAIGIVVDGVNFGASYSVDQYQLGGPGWRGDKVDFTIYLRGLRRDQTVEFDARWGSSAEWGNIAYGWVNQSDCSFTTNPRQR